MVEEIKDFPAELYDFVLANFRSLDDREVGVIETWAGYHIAAVITEVINRLTTDKGDWQHSHGTGWTGTARTRIAHQIRKPLNAIAGCSSGTQNSNCTTYVWAQSSEARQGIGVRCWDTSCQGPGIT